MLRTMLIPFVCTLAFIVSSCGPTGTTTPTGTITITVAVDKTANTTAADPSINVTLTNSSSTTVGTPITAVGPAAAQTFPEGTYTVVAPAPGGYTVNITPSANIVVAAATPASVTVTYVAQAPVTGGAVTPAKTFTSPLGIGSLAFMPAGTGGAGRLYASGNASIATDISGRLYLEPSDISGAGSAPVAVPSFQVVQGTVADPTPLVEIAFNASGVFYQLRRDPRADFQTPISRYPRTTAVSNSFADEQFVITNGFFNPTPSTSDRSLTAPTDMAIDASGNLWVVDPTGNARSWRGDVSGTPAGRLVCYSAADQSAASTTRPTAPGTVGTPGVIYHDGPAAGARTIVIEPGAGGAIWIGSGTGANARLHRVTSLACPNLPTSQDPQVVDLAPTPPATLPAGVTIRTLSGASLVGPVDLAISGSNLLVAQSNLSTNNILSVALSATSLPTTNPTTLNGLSGNITSLAVDSGGKIWVGSSGAAAPNPGRIYQLP